MLNDSPTLWAEEFAREHDLKLRFEPMLPGGVSGYKYDGPDGVVVVLDAALPPERQHFALAHEAAHILLGHTGEVEADEEFQANQLASELLLPHESFAPHAWRPIRELKELFPHVSFEALARRKLMYCEGVLTILDDGRVTRRLNSEGFAAPPQPIAEEWALIERCYVEKQDCTSQLENLSLAATYVDSNPQILRVLLLVEAE